MQEGRGINQYWKGEIGGDAERQPHSKDLQKIKWKLDHSFHGLDQLMYNGGCWADSHRVGGY